MIVSRLIAIFLGIILFPVYILLYLFILFSSGRPVFFKQKRIGKNNSYFYLYKFRTMKINTPDVATHLLDNPQMYYIRLGLFFRKFSLDELPQLFNIIKGDMVFIGPRPALFNQFDLIDLRTKHGIHKLKPGITGWAQINGRDSISIEKKVALERDYLSKKSISFDLKIIIYTFVKVLSVSDVNQ